MAESGGPEATWSRARTSGLLQGLASELMRLLMSEGARPGTRLPPERQLATRLGVGRSSVREALKSLSLLGLVEARQGDGNYLAAMDPDLVPRLIEWGLELDPRSFTELIEARYVVELATAPLAASRRVDAHLVQMDDLLARMEQAGDDVTAFIEHDVAFHLAVAAAAGNDVLGTVLKSIHSLLRVWMTHAIDQARGTVIFAEQHRGIFEKIKERDAGGAAAAMELHLASAYEHLKLSLQQDPAFVESLPELSPSPFVQGREEPT